MKFSLLRLALLVLLFGVPSPLRAQSALVEDPDLGQEVVEGFATPDVIWLRGATGKVVEFSRSTGARRVVATDIVDLHLDGDSLWSLSARRGSGSSLIVRDLRRPEAPPEEVRAPGRPLAILSRGESRFVLTHSHIASKIDGRWLARSLRIPIMGGRARLEMNGLGELFMGVDYGEWGGGLHRIEAATGERRPIFFDDPPPPYCNGALNLHCDGIYGLFQDPAAEACVIASSGNIHMVSRGAIVRICGGEAEALHQVADSGGGTRPFTSLAPTATGWVAISGVEAWTSGGTVAVTQSRPPLRKWAGLRLNDERRDVLFVQSACCWPERIDGGYRIIAVPVVDAR